MTVEAIGEVVGVAYDHDRMMDNPWEIAVGLHPWIHDTFTMRVADAKAVRIGDRVTIAIDTMTQPPDSRQRFRSSDTS